MKKLYFKFSDNGDISNVILTLKECMDIIESELQNASQEEDLYEYTIVPTWLTEEEVSALPEWEG